MNQDTLLTLRSATCSPEGVPYGLLPVTPNLHLYSPP